ncbi:unnamed protein product [Acanthosepion pharaonis]|uniref:Uncharacterized protein n=1 Tax=Acanthosepion pharaonis TaxID=158019 RepID=A0A812BP29_ACAPH|nr:unnamed protein product [Sepia pharaonis]
MFFLNSFCFLLLFLLGVLFPTHYFHFSLFQAVRLLLYFIFHLLFLLESVIHLFILYPNFSMSIPLYSSLNFFSIFSLSAIYLIFHLLSFNLISILFIPSSFLHFPLTPTTVYFLPSQSPTTLWTLFSISSLFSFSPKSHQILVIHLNTSSFSSLYILFFTSFPSYSSLSNSCYLVYSTVSLFFFSSNSPYILIFTSSFYFCTFNSICIVFSTSNLSSYFNLFSVFFSC